jgi:hypothetical protein
MNEALTLTTIGSSSLQLSVSPSHLPEAGEGGKTLWLFGRSRRLAITFTREEAGWLAERLACASESGRP